MNDKTFIITNESDCLDCFEVEAANLLDAALKALQELGWNIGETED